MGTLVEITAIDKDKRKIHKAIEAAFDEIKGIDALMSNYKADSEVSLINRQAGLKPVKVSLHTFHVIKRSLYFSDLTQGAFDITVGPLIEKWKFDQDTTLIPSEKQIKKLKALVKYKDIQLNEMKGTVMLKAKGMKIDLGGIAKGFGVDMAIEVLKKARIQKALVNAGGDLRALGTKEDGKPWNIGIRHPMIRDKILATLEVSDFSVATSGDYERFFEKDGNRYHHILNPHTGYPTKGVRSVTILSKEATEADALATSLFVLGPKEGMELVERMEAVEAVIVDDKGEIHISSGLQGKLEF